MAIEETLVLIKPDAVVKGLQWSILEELDSLNLELKKIKIVKVNENLAKKHYFKHKKKPFFEGLIKHITGKLHEDAKVIALVYKGENAINKIREFVGNTNPEEASPKSIRGKYGRINHKIDCFENVLHSSDSKDSAKREIELWFGKDAN